jgi:hypothetical protein
MYACFRSLTTHNFKCYFCDLLVGGLILLDEPAVWALAAQVQTIPPGASPQVSVDLQLSDLRNSLQLLAPAQ